MKEQRIILIGEADSKGTEFFLKAANRQQVSGGVLSMVRMESTGY